MLLFIFFKIEEMTMDIQSELFQEQFEHYAAQCEDSSKTFDERAKALQRMIQCRNLKNSISTRRNIN